MMNKLITIILSFLLVMPVVAEEVDKTLDAAPDGQVNISNIAGSITVTGWTRDAVEVTGTLGRNVEELIFERNRDRVTIKVKVPRRGGRGIESDLRISVPQGSSIDISGVSADIDVTDVMGEQRLQTVSGDVSTESAGNDVMAESVSGDVEIDGDKSDTETTASTVSGDVTLFRVSGTVRAESVSGDVIVDEGSFSRADLSVVNGDLLFHAELRQDGKLAAETVNGDVDVELVGDVSAKIDVSTINGRIRNCFGPEPERSSKYTPGWSLSFTEGDGDGRVDISTVNGGVSLCRK
ncbi:MAG: DUF4097 domain-containing protein [Gammaproteobacteria bacterium]|nr:DUF4097 domain-containing protein [Gammaproteobacteria bacterium]NND47309.1 DUF4097 family beta strand repeat protein [Woeseiaceae bacterium]NNL44674.1 DUF4097 family beta strand repeat protein [Woeseiaceae bacterium]